jgi:4-amino-4-deoxy-L-arabinose transferase-like glycosyltransferase
MQVPSSLRLSRRTLIGLIIIATAHLILLQKEALPYNPFSLFSKGWQITYRIDLTPSSNILLALWMLVAGSVLLWYGTLPRPKDQTVQDLGPALAPLRPTKEQSVLFWLALISLASVLICLLLFGFYKLLVPLWIGAFLLLALACWRYDLHKKVVFKSNLQPIDYGWIAASLALAFVSNSYRLGSLPADFIGDEWSFWSNARDIARNSYDVIPFNFGVYSYPILSSIYQSWFLNWFGFNLWSWRFSSVVASLAALPPTYLLARHLFDRRVAVISCFILGSMPFFMAFARLGYNNSQAIAPIVLSCYLLVVGLRRQSSLLVVLAGGAAGLGFYTYTAGRLGLIICLLWLASIAFGEYRKRRKNKPEALAQLRQIARISVVYLLGWGFVVLPHYAFSATVEDSLHSYKIYESLFPNAFYGRHLYIDDQLFRDLPPIEMGNQTFFVRADLYADLLVRSTIRTFLAFQDHTILESHFILGPLPGPLLALPFLYGFILVLRNWRLTGYRLLAIWIVVGSLLLSIINTFPPRSTHLVAIMPAIAIISALGLVQIWQQIAQLAPPQVRSPALHASLLNLSVLVVVASGLFSYLVVTPQHYQPSVEDVINFHILALQEPEQIVFLTSNPDQEEFSPIVVREMETLAQTRTFLIDQEAKELPILDQNLPLTIFCKELDCHKAEQWLHDSHLQTFAPQISIVEGGELLLRYSSVNP